jgi:hypothetical protein
MYPTNRTRCFWQVSDPTAPGRSIFHRADLNLPADPLLAEESGAAFQSYPSGRAMPPIEHRLVSAARATTLSPYAHGQNAARHGKHVQACPFDTGTVEWRQWRDGFRAVSGRTE